MPHELHDHTKAVLAGDVTPPKVHDADADELNAAEAFCLKVTVGVGTPICAAIFAVLAFVSLPTTLKLAGYYSGPDLGTGTVLVVSWVAQTFLQLVLLAIILYGQTIQAKGADRRAEQTYADTEAILHELAGLHRRLDEREG